MVDVASAVETLADRLMKTVTPMINAGGANTEKVRRLQPCTSSRCSLPTLTPPPT